MVPDNTTVLLFLVWYIQEMHLGTIFILRKDVLAFLNPQLPYSEVPNRRACSLRFFRFSSILLAIFPPARLLFYLVK